MRYRKLGRTGLVVSELCLGTMTFGGDDFWRVIGALQQDAANELVRDAFAAGVNFFDTADVYSSGVSETILGQSIKALGVGRDEVVIATKAFGRFYAPASGGAADAQEVFARRQKSHNTWGLSRKHLFDAVDASLKRLAMDHIDLYQVHAFDPVTPLEETLGALDDIVKSGRVRYIGLCNMAAWQIAKSLGISARKQLARFESAQMYYTIAGRDLEREVVPLAQDESLAILPWSPLAGGFLSGKYQRNAAGPNDSRRVSFDFPPVNKDRAYDCIDAMNPMASARDASVAGVALGWLLAKPWVTSVIIGAKTPEQLKQNLAAVDVKLSAEEMAVLDKVSELPREYPGWMLERQGGERTTGIA
ncbi:MAG: aldo/keto reductase [Hyphomonadaceae bacterium]|nr:MAG: aldo/keto reductase [Caulobacteraceae bacterium]MBT9444491.1 aldo/keto reductase [Hyphomonadaceae bacterium]